ELGRLELRELEADTAAQRVVEAAAEEADSLLDVLRRHVVGSDLLGQARVELEERLVRDLPAEHRVDLGVDRLRADVTLVQPRRRAVREPLELRGAERRL